MSNHSVCQPTLLLPPIRLLRWHDSCDCTNAKFGANWCNCSFSFTVVTLNFHFQNTFKRFFPAEVTSTDFPVDRIEAAAMKICKERMKMIAGLNRFDAAEKIVTVKYETVCQI